MADNDQKSERVIAPDDWDLVRFTDEMQLFEPFCAPRPVARREYSDKWKFPQPVGLELFTLSELFPEALLADIQSLTGTVLVPSHDKGALWIGADTEREAIIAKKKLTTLANCWVRSIR